VIALTLKPVCSITIVVYAISSRKMKVVHNILSCLSQKKDNFRAYLERLRNEALAEIGVWHSAAVLYLTRKSPGEQGNKVMS
jgi:hypothetical protein